MDVNADLALIARQEALLQFASFGPDAAWALGSRLHALADERDAPVAIDIFAQGRVLFHAARRGATPDNAEWVRRKRNVVLRFFRSSYGMGLQLTRDGRTLEERYGLPPMDYMAHGGSFPLLLRGTGCIGAVTVSGLPQREDHKLVVRALAEEAGLSAADLALD